MEKTSTCVDNLLKDVDNNQQNFENNMELLADEIQNKCCNNIPDFKKKDLEAQKEMVRTYLNYLRHVGHPRITEIEQKLHFANLKTLGISKKRRGQFNIRVLNSIPEEVTKSIHKTIIAMEYFVDKKMIPESVLSFEIIDDIKEQEDTNKDSEEDKDDSNFGRSYYDSDTQCIYLEGEKQQNDISVIAHEMGHFIEENILGVKELCTDFIEARTNGEEEQKLNDLMPNIEFDESETTRPDHFPNPYCGKIYPDGTTELLSTGIQMLVTAPRKFYEQDPEYFFLVLGIVRGEFKNYKQGVSK